MKQIQQLSQVQSQKQVQRLSQIQIQAINFLAKSNKDLREEIYKAVEENPALMIVKDSVSPRRDLQDSYSRRSSAEAYEVSDANLRALEAVENRGETLQEHLMFQLNMQKLSQDEKELCEKLIYSLDEEGFFDNMIAPESLLNKARPAQNKKMLDRCIKIIQNMDPVGTCCKSAEESLYIQAQIAGDAPELSLYILEDLKSEKNLTLQDLTDPKLVLKKLKQERKENQQKFGGKESLLDQITLDEEAVIQAMKYFKNLYLHPAADFISDTSQSDFMMADIILSIKKKKGPILQDDFNKGLVTGGSDFHFSVTYPDGELPQVEINPEFKQDKKLIEEAKKTINLLVYRQHAVILLGCAIVSQQKDYFIKGEGHLKPLTRRKIASLIGVHESTVSRMTGKKDKRLIDVMGVHLPASYFFVSGVGSANTSSDLIKKQIKDLHSASESPLSDEKITRILNDQGIKISRRTVNKYRKQLGIENSYEK